MAEKATAQDSLSTLWRGVALKSVDTHSRAKAKSCTEMSSEGRALTRSAKAKQSFSQQRFSLQRYGNKLNKEELIIENK